MALILVTTIVKHTHKKIYIFLCIALNIFIFWYIIYCITFMHNFFVFFWGGRSIIIWFTQQILVLHVCDPKHTLRKINYFEINETNFAINVLRPENLVIRFHNALRKGLSIYKKEGFCAPWSFTTISKSGRDRILTKVSVTEYSVSLNLVQCCILLI